MSHLNAGSPLSRITHKTEEFWSGRLYFPVMLAVTAVSMLTGNVMPSTVLLVLLCGWMLVFCRDILAAALPFLLIFLLSTLQYTSLSVFLPCAPLAVVPIGGLLVRIVLSCDLESGAGGRGPGPKHDRGHKLRRAVGCGGPEAAHPGGQK